MTFDLIAVLVILVLSIIIVLFAPEPKSRLADIGGVAFLLYLLLVLLKYLLGRT